MEQILRSASRLLYPLVIWTYVFIGVKLAAGSAANAPILAVDFWRLPLPPYQHLWFLWALFLIQSILSPLGVLQIGLRKVVVPLLFVASVAFFLSGFFPGVLWIGTIFGLPFFFLGVLLSQTNVAVRSYVSPLTAVMAFSLTQAIIGLITNVSMSAALIGGMSCSISVVILSQSSLLKRQNWLKVLGRCSMSIYLAHTVFSAMVRIGMLKLGVTDAFVHMLFGVLFGLLGPMAFHTRWVPNWIRQFLGFAPLRGFGRWTAPTA